VSVFFKLGFSLRRHAPQLVCSMPFSATTNHMNIGNCGKTLVPFFFTYLPSRWEASGLVRVLLDGDGGDGAGIMEGEYALERDCGLP
jgi:hypothetical protein